MSEAKLIDFKAGDFVQLKSGGPKMTVERFGPHGASEPNGALCTWFEGKKRHTEWFELPSLKKVE